jgi:deaminated glutathione amidase
LAAVTVATCQFPVSADVRANLGYITRQLGAAARRGAQVAHFPEAALSGYAVTDFDRFTGYHWAELDRALTLVLARARRERIWAVLGSAHRLTGPVKPHNSLYVISDSGEIIDRYDKRFCGGDPAGQTADLAYYSAGDHFSTWTIGGVRCGALICYDYRFPELYREYKKLGVELMFHSFHAANSTPADMAERARQLGPQYEVLNRAATFCLPAITMPAAMTTAAACNHVWISCPNSSAPESCWPAFMMRADGVTVGRLRRNRPGVLLTTVDTEATLYDSTAAWRGRAMAGQLHSGTPPADPRSADRTGR